MVSLNRWQKERPGQKFLVTWGDIIGENLATVSYYILNYCQTPTSNYPCSRVTCKLLLLSHVSFPLSKTKASSFKGPPMFSNSLILSLSLSLSLFCFVPVYVRDMASTCVIGLLAVLLVLQPWIALSDFLAPFLSPVIGLWLCSRPFGYFLL